MAASLPPREAWIEIPVFLLLFGGCVGRFPRGKRGLKLETGAQDAQRVQSLPLWEAWIEIVALKTV